MKSTIAILSSIAVIIVSVILNIVLLATDMFKGTYSADLENGTAKIEFYDNTYELTYYYKGDKSISVGFYIDNDDTYSLYDPFDPKTEYIISRENVFCFRCIAVKSDSFYKPPLEGAVFYCTAAIFLQVLYPLLIVIAILIIILTVKDKIFKDKSNEDDSEGDNGLDAMENGADDEESEHRVLCANCGFQIFDEEMYCSNCGAKRPDANDVSDKDVTAP